MVTLVLASGCERNEDAAPSPRESIPAEGTSSPEGAKSDGPPAPSDDAESGSRADGPSGEGPASSIEGAGLHRVEGGHALAFQTGASLPEVQDIVERGVEAGVLKVQDTGHEKKTLRGTDVHVTTQALALKGGTPVSKVRLTYFDDVLVGVVQEFWRPEPARLAATEKTYGEGMAKTGWVGWWHPQADRIVQWRSDGSRREVFDLAAAGSVVPDVRKAMLRTWVARYGAPPVWLQRAAAEMEADAGP